MCERFILVNTMEQIESRFELPHQSIPISPNYNISVGQFVPVITCDKPHEIKLLKFGLTPFWAKKEMLIINARSEGDSNREDKPGFKGSKGIILKPAFRKPIRSQRCLVLASALIEFAYDGKLSKPYLVFLRDHQHPFAFAGIWDTWLNPQTGDNINSFSIITTSANSLMQKISQHRMPVILSRNEEKKWINPHTGLSTITSMLNHYESKLMNAYPIDPRIKNPLNNDKQLILPIGERVLIEEKPTIRQPYSSGYYHSVKKLRDHDPFRPYNANDGESNKNENPYA